MWISPIVRPKTGVVALGGALEMGEGCQLALDISKESSSSGVDTPASFPDHSFTVPNIYHKGL